MLAIPTGGDAKSAQLQAPALGSVRLFMWRPSGEGPLTIIPRAPNIDALFHKPNAAKVRKGGGPQVFYGCLGGHLNRPSVSRGGQGRGWRGEDK